MAAPEQQHQRVITLLGGSLARHERGGLLAAPPSRLATPDIDQASHGNGGEPRPRVARQMLGPDAECLDHRLLHGILSRDEILSAPNQPGQHLRCQGPGGQVNVVRSPLGAPDQAITSRTSIHS